MLMHMAQSTIPPLGQETAPTETAEPGLTAAPPAAPLLPGDRFDVIESVGRGGYGTVWKVRDRVLEREIALKVIEPPTDRALTEARVAATLQHPGIVPIYEVGHFDDGRGWIAMRFVQGVTFRDFIHQAQAPFRVAISHVQRVAEAIAYAHVRGIIHRDLKPANISVGKFGEIIVLDWGIAETIQTQAPRRAGSVGFVAPEQLEGAAPDPRADVFSLGKLLAATLRAYNRAELEPDLAVLIDAAIRPELTERLASAATFARRLGAWAAGEARREAARAQAEAAKARLKSASEHRAQAQRLLARAVEIAGPLEPYAPAEQKSEVWALEDAAAEHELAAQRDEGAAEGRLREMLRNDPATDDAELLLNLYRHRVVAAERAGDTARAQQALDQLNENEFSPTLAQPLIAETGRIVVRARPAGARIFQAPYARRSRRLVVGDEAELGAAPLEAIDLPLGRHRLRIEAPGCAPAVIPVHVERHGIAPPLAIDVTLPPRHAVDEDECFVPGGWFISGGDALAVEGLPRRRIWIDPFIIQRDPLTYRRLLPLLDQMCADGRADLAAQIAPPPSDPKARGNDGFLSVVRDPSGYHLKCDDPSMLDWPVTMISWFGAVKLAQYLAETTGKPWRLPHGLEREKAARGTDGRHLPWGDFFEHTWACTVHARPGQPSRAPVDAFSIDVSPYGVRGMAGNVRDWCVNVFRRDGQPQGDRLPVQAPDQADNAARISRGGAWGARPALCRPTGRFAAAPDGRYFFVGARFVRSLPIECHHPPD